MRVLLVEDDPMVGEAVRKGLRQDGFTIDWVQDGKSADVALRTEDYAMLLLDLGLPQKDGLAVLRTLRERGSAIPVLITTARDAVADRVAGLDAGADDYLIKPFSIEELLLKIEIFLKRSQKNGVKKSVYEIGKYQFDTENFILFNETEKISLTQRESDLLKLFVDNKNLVLKRQQILTSLWGDDDYFMGRSLDVFISRLRKILATEKGISIENLHGIGFRFTM